MSYPPPPGAANSSTLPTRLPPPNLASFKPAFPAGSTPASSAGLSASYGANSTYSGAPGHVGSAPSQYGAAYPTYPQQVAMNAAPGFQPRQTYGQTPYPQQQQQPGYYVAPADNSSHVAAPPQIRNPFPAPAPATSQGSDYDPGLAAQIAQWQSAYVKDPKDGSALPSRPGPGPAPTTYSGEATKTADTNAIAIPGHPDKKKTVVRAGGGQKWTDDTLLEWDPAHLRLFVGNLAGETTDESLYKAFSRWKSLQKARVIRDKVTSKSKGFGFVSFSDPDEFFAAAKEMNGKYIQSHPVTVRKSTTEIKPTTIKDKHGGKWNKKNRNKNRGGNGSGNGGAKGESTYEPSLGPHGAGITKPGQKTKGGLKLLG